MKKTNKIISILLAVAMLLSMIPLSFTVSAAPDTDYTGYYTIKNAGNLAWFACLVVGDTSQSGITAAEPDAKAVLTADIDITVLSSRLGKTWVGIGTEEIPFTGIFDGNGYTIKGLTTDTSLTKSSVATVAVDTTKQGLFGVIGEGGVVRDVVVEGTATLSDTIQYGGICSENNGTIENVVSLVTVTGGDNADVFCHTNNGTITNSFTNQTTAVTSGVTVVDADTLASGSVTHALGSSFGQIIDTDTQPVHYDGTNTVYKDGDTYTNTAPSYAASVTDKDGNALEGSPYKTFSEAVTAAKASEGSVLTLLDSIILTEQLFLNSGKFILDLNGKTLYNESGTVLYIYTGVTLTIKDSGTGGTVENKANSATAIFNYGTLTVESGTFKSPYHAIDNHGTLTVEDGSFEGTHSIYIVEGTAKLNGGTFIGKVWSFTGYEINGGDYTASHIGINAAEKTLTVNGGTFNIDEIRLYKGNASLKGGEFPEGLTLNDLNNDGDDEKYLNDILADGYFYRDEDGNIITVAEDATTISGYVKVTKGADFEADAVVTLSETEFTYNGEKHEPTVTVKIGGKALTENTHYTYTYSNNINAGTATVTVTGAGDYSGKEIVKTFEIKKADSSFATEPAANALTYSGEAQELITAGSTADGTMVYSLDGETYSETIPAGEAAKEYTVYYKVIGDINHNDTEPATVTVTIKAKDISDATVTLGDALTYNGAEQTQTVAKVEIPAGFDVTYSVSGNTATNVGVYQLTVTGTGNFEGNVTLTYKISPDTSGIDDLTVDNVKSSDKAAVEAVKAQIDNAVTDLADDFTKAEYKAISDKCDGLLTVINEIEDELARIEKAVNAYDEATVKSTDKADLEQLKADIKALTDADNITDDEGTKLGELDAAIDELIRKIDDTSAEIARIETAVNAYDVSTVKSTDKADLEQLVADIKALTDGQNITADERTNLEALDATADALLAKIAETTGEYDRVIAAANGYDKSTVTSADKDALVQLNKDIYALALTNNVTSNEKTQLMTAHINVFGCIQKVTYVSEELKRIIEAVDKYVFESVKSTDKADIQQLIADIQTLLDGQNITADERTLLETADETCNKLIAKIDETVAEISRIDEATNAYDIDTVTSADKADIEKLIADIKALTDGNNITDAERAQLVANDETLDELLAKINATADEIARIEEAVNAYDEDTVKSSDKADIEQLIADIKALTDATNITEDERTALEALDATADALIKKIDDTQAEIDRINEAVNSYDEKTVTSADIPEIGKLVEDIKAIADGNNLTEEEKTALEDTKAAINVLIEKLTEVAKEIARVDNAVKSYDEDIVKSSDSEDLAQLKEDVQALIDSTNTTENEKTVLKEMINTIEGLEDKIAETEQQLEEIKGIENGYDSETVTSDDKAAIEDVIAKIEAVNPDNLTDEQKAEYEEIKAGFEALLEKIEAAENAVAEIGAELEMFDEDRVTIFWEDDIEALKAKIDELLADENMGQPEKAKLNEYKAQAEKLIEIINTPREYLSLRFFYLIWDCLNWKWNGLKYLFDLIF